MAHAGGWRHEDGPELHQAVVVDPLSQAILGLRRAPAPYWCLMEAQNEGHHMTDLPSASIVVPICSSAEHIGARLDHGRLQGVRARDARTTGDVVAYLDDDPYGQSGWLAEPFKTSGASDAADVAGPAYNDRAEVSRALDQVGLRFRDGGLTRHFAAVTPSDATVGHCSWQGRCDGDPALGATRGLRPVRCPVVRAAAVAGCRVSRTTQREPRSTSRGRWTGLVRSGGHLHNVSRSSGWQPLQGRAQSTKRCRGATEDNP